MKARRLASTESLGYCHDCHNRAKIIVSFAHRDPIRLCDRCGRFLIMNVGEVIKRNGKNGNGKNHKKGA